MNSTDDEKKIGEKQNNQLQEALEKVHIKRTKEVELADKLPIKNHRVSIYEFNFLGIIAEINLFSGQCLFSYNQRLSFVS